ncbi:MAG TPA: metal-dependent hydrolase [Bryobacteraceae bacterium]|jgi:inner membrane protein
MDNVTHTLTGLMMARAGLARKGEHGATLVILLAANAPDIDVVVAGLPGGLRYLEYHRGYTHALLMAPVMALLALLLGYWIQRAKLDWFNYGASLLAVLSHLAYDLTNVYGIRLLLPFSSRWLRLDITDIIDPWILIILIVAISAPALAGIVGSEISGRKSAPPRAAWATFALLAIFCYEGFRLASHARAIAVMGARLYGGVETPRISAMPDTIDPLRWRGIVETEDFVLTVNLMLTEDYIPNFGRVDYPTKSSPAIDAARTTEPFQIFEQFDQLPFWKVSSASDAIKVELIDMRFGTPSKPGFFVATALVTQDGHVLESHMGP